MKHKSFAKKATNSFVGRILRRLLGEERGTVMMEYVVIGLLIAAVAVVAVGVFGSAITDMFAALTAGVIAKPTAITTTLSNTRDNVVTGIGNSTDHKKNIANDDKYAQEHDASTEVATSEN